METNSVFNAKGLCLTTFSDSCEGMCKRVLDDIKGYDEKELMEMIYNDYAQGGRSYDSIVELGELIKSIQEKCGIR